MFGLFIFGGYSLASATSSETRMAGAVPLIVAVPAISAVSASRPSTSAPSWAPERPAAEQLRVIVGHLLAQTAPPNGSRSSPHAPRRPAARSRASTRCRFRRLSCKDSTEGGVQVTEVQKAQRRVKAVRAIRRSTELEGSRSTNATRADQVAYARGSITAAELGDRVRRRYNVK